MFRQLALGDVLNRATEANSFAVLVAHRFGACCRPFKGQLRVENLQINLVGCSCLQGFFDYGLQPLPTFSLEEADVLVEGRRWQTGIEAEKAVQLLRPSHLIGS